MKLTEVNFWNNYWRNYKLPSVVDFTFSFERCLADKLREHLRGATGDAIEIGCAPGKWLAFLSKELGLNVHGIEYSDSGMAATVENFRLLNLDISSIKTGDFFKINPEPKFDVVMSLGFIEHFDNPNYVLDLHLKWLKPGGILVIGVPNFTGINGTIQKILDKSIIDKHNLNIMNLEYFTSLTKTFNLNTIFLGYICSFEPSLFISNNKFGNPLKFFVKLILRFMILIRKFDFIDKLNNKLYSSYILGVYKKEE